MRKIALALLLVLAATPARADPSDSSAGAPVRSGSARLSTVDAHWKYDLPGGRRARRRSRRRRIRRLLLIGGSFGVVVGGVAGALVGDWWYVNYADEDEH